MLLVALVAAVFWQTGSFQILNFDDDQYIDAVVLEGLTWNGFMRAWTEGHVGQWHPLTTLSFMLDAQLFGRWWGGYHLHNALLHAAAASVLFAALTRLTGSMSRSLVAAGIFAIHPLRAESVAWITERKDVLSGLFLALSLWAYAWYVEKPSSWKRYGLLLGSFAAGLMSKTILVTLPIGLLILDWWPLGRLATGPEPERRSRAEIPQRTRAELVVEKLPLLAIAAAVAVATYLSVGDVVRPINTLPFPVRAMSSVVAYASYVLQFFWPIGLAPHYPYSAVGPTMPQVAIAGAFVAIMTAAAWGLRRRWPALTTGWAWYLVTLLPVVGFVPGGIQLIADRYTYVSQIWLVVALVWLLADWAERLRISKSVSLAVAAVALLGLTFGCWWQTRHWRDSESLWRYTLAVTGDNAYAHANLASVLSQQGDRVGAAEQNRKALALESDNLIALSNLATLYVDTGKAGEAVKLYERSVGLNPKFLYGWFNLGNAYQKLGRINDAERAWTKATELEPRMGAAWNNLAGLALDRGDVDDAVAMAEKASAGGGGAAAAMTLGRALDAAGRLDEAAAAYRRAVDGDPRSAVAANNLGSVLERTGHLEEAAGAFRRAVRLDPTAPVFHYNLGVVLARQGNRMDAAASFTAAEQRFRAAGNGSMADAVAERREALGVETEEKGR
ncbi:MAG: O-GlcNAc transferase [Planctomycetota bacterium]